MCKCTVIIKADIIKGVNYCYYANVRDYHWYINSAAGVLTLFVIPLSAFSPRVSAL